MNVALACLWEATARKVGNVHPGAAFADMEYFDFVRSGLALEESWRSGFVSPTRERGAHPHRSITAPAELPNALGPSLARRANGSALGSRIHRGVAASRAAVGKNTNLGIVLLLAPLLDGRETRLSETTVEDARWLYRAVRLAAPGGLGEAKDQNVHAEPTCTLLEAMALAADRDMVARQYANDFADVLDFGVPAFTDAFARLGCIEGAIIGCQLRWLAAFPDSLIARKNGPAVAADVQRRAADVLTPGGLETPAGRAAGVALDRHLRSEGHALNPGTTADLVTACLFVALREGKIDPAAPFRWNVPDWL